MSKMEPRGDCRDQETGVQGVEGIASEIQDVSLKY